VRYMPEFFHERADVKTLIETLSLETKIFEQVIEKDYWIMHCLWGLQQLGLAFEMKGGTSLSKGWGMIDRFSEDIDIRFDAPETLNLKGDKPAHINARRAFYDDLASRMQIPGIKAVRETQYDDEKGQNGGISLKYESHFVPLAGIRPAVLLEAGFDRTAPNEARDFSSWVYDRAVKARLDIADNRALGVRCYNPEYTFVDKLQTICRRYRQFRERNDPDKDRPREFLRHYYDLYRLLEAPRVNTFIGTLEYDAYKRLKIKTADGEYFETREPFMLEDPKIYALFEQEFDHMNTMLLAPAPKFKDLVERLREQTPKF